jgi:nicotinamide riboside kinase
MEKDLRQEDINLVKIVLFGPESTGKTTLSIQLAKHYNTVMGSRIRQTLPAKSMESRKKNL